MQFSDKLRHVLQRSPRFLIAVSLFVAVAGRGTAEILIYKGNIITYKLTDEPEKYEYAHAIAVDTENGTIVAIGSTVDEVKKSVNGIVVSRVCDLKGTLIPGFVDAHSHFAQVGFLEDWANLLPPPDGDGQQEVKSILDIQKRLKDLKERLADCKKDDPDCPCKKTMPASFTT
ncbi:MAG: hypothetical protein QOF89_2632 [Acidobacteriota bacterium]|jgi:predicted amidohydrolase YtcJ|nr:hypothetical protein [Acidobacteriota bacterium]